ncbi:hypothetical protein BJ508DRAFT_358467 [Ascobolus immersus RN42]|uniref:BTB domain-containing protein n=1 Tax=Ascobolus immersus RN42 TaxID=1160509 RepID=A0A3N4IJ77_ASCIM|nr:hypothetical protein BJ508DRAFT_358467 [Ascobolus immersus RN42]
MAETADSLIAVISAQNGRKKRRRDTSGSNDASRMDLGDDDSPSDCESTISNMSIPDDTEPVDRVPALPISKPDWSKKLVPHLQYEAATHSLFMCDLYSDFKIICGDYVFPAHKFIVCPQSEYFTCVFRGGFLENQESTIRITDEKPSMIYRLLYFFYFMEYNDEPDELKGGEASTEFRAKVNFTMYRIADKYGVPGLAKIAAEQQAECLAYCAEQLDDSEDTVVWCIRKAYRLFKGRNDPMRLLQMEAMAEYWKDKDYGTEIRELKAFRAACEESGEFAMDFIDCYEWQRAFNSDRASDLFKRRGKWVENAKGGWDLILEWKKCDPSWTDRYTQRRGEVLP